MRKVEMVQMRARVGPALSRFPESTKVLLKMGFYSDVGDRIADLRSYTRFEIYEHLRWLGPTSGGDDA